MQPVPPLADGFEQCDGVPCYMGIVPGKTSWITIEERFGNRATGRADDMLEIRASYDAPTSIELRQADNGTVSDVVIRFYRPQNLIVGNIVATYGLPCIIRYSSVNQPSGVWLGYPYFAVVAGVSVRANRLFLDHQSSVYAIGLFGPLLDGCESQEFVAGGIRQEAWSGFTWLRTYNGPTR
jgi:hypothetical protein